jgi:citrate synthase
MKKWIDRSAALERLMVKPQTLYAYVSRGLIRMEPDPADARRSLYSAEDIKVIATRNARGRKRSSIAASSMAWGEPAIATSLSMVHQGKLHYRGLDASALSSNATLEEVAALLWVVKELPVFAAESANFADPFQALAALTPNSPCILGRTNESLAKDAALVIGQLATVCGGERGSGQLHERLAHGWGCDALAADRIRQALVLMADHDLNASTFATRVAASTGASLPASLLAGLCTLSGPRHGGAAEALSSLLSDASRLGAADAVQLWLSRDQILPGFGHPLYPGGDPRAIAMLKGLIPSGSLLRLSDSVFEQAGLLPNCDFALAVMTEAFGLPADAPFCLFLLGRSVGWTAHVMEQNSSGTLIRPRGKYEGVLPSAAVATSPAPR